MPKHHLLLIAIFIVAGCASQAGTNLGGFAGHYIGPSLSCGYSFDSTDNPLIPALNHEGAFILEDESGEFCLSRESRARIHSGFLPVYGFHNSVSEEEEEFPFEINESVYSYLEYFQSRGRGTYAIWLSRSRRYMPMMKRIFMERGVPQDLVLLAMLESGFDERAKSQRGNAGPWQFVASTAKRYGLRVDAWVDERMDPIKSTFAAAGYLKDLYDSFRDWHLAVAGFNAGESRVAKALERAEDKDFWEGAWHALPPKTNDFVSRLIAVSIIAREPEKYGFSGVDYHEPLEVEKVLVPPHTSLKDVAARVSIDYRLLYELNPSLVRGVTPPDSPYEINVPVGYGKVVKESYGEMALSATGVYTVRRGDTLSKIARDHAVGVEALLKLNAGINPKALKPGDIVLVPSLDSYRR